MKNKDKLGSQLNQPVGFLVSSLKRMFTSSLACVASVSVWFRSKKRPWKGIFGFDRARNETRTRSFTCVNFLAVFDSCSSFSAPEPHRNACYAGYVKSSQSAQKRPYVRGTQREYNSKPLKHSIVQRTLVSKRQIQAYFYPLKMFHLFGFPS